MTILNNKMGPYSVHRGVESKYKLDTELEKAFHIPDLIAVPERSSLAFTWAASVLLSEGL